MVGLRTIRLRPLHGSNRTPPLDRTLRKIIIMIIILNSFIIKSKVIIILIKNKCNNGNIYITNLSVEIIIISFSFLEPFLSSRH
jgi:hypothetical protein